MPETGASSTQPLSPYLTLDQILAIRPHGGTEGPQWTPDGLSVTFVSNLGGSPELWCVSPEGDPVQQLTTGMGSVGHLATFVPRWSPSGQYVAFITTRTGVDEVWLQPIDGGAMFQLTRLGGRIEALSWSPDGRSIAVASNARGAFDIYIVSVADGRHERVTSDERYEVYPSFMPDGEHVLFVRLNDAWTDHEVVRIETDGSNPEVILTDHDFFDYHYGRTFGYPTVSPDGSTFLFRSHRSGWINVWAARTDGHGEPRRIAPAEADQGDAVWSPDGARIAYVENHDGLLDLRVVPADGGQPRVLVAPGMGVVTEPAWSPDGSRIACLYGTPTSPNDVGVVDVESGAWQQLTRSMLAAGVQSRLVSPEKIRYPSFDGREISAYLYRPHRQQEARRYPGLLWIHGGPTAQFMDTWQPQVQFFVSQGYVVLLPNIRGSSGYGREFEDLNNGDWGHGDLQDAISGVDYLKTLDDVDPDSFGITGTSYGGILSMAAVAWAPPGIFKAAIPCSGYGDFVHMSGEQELRHIKLLEYEFGTLPEAGSVYRHCSPIFDLANATTPCFVLHGEGRYPGSTAGRDFALALERHYKPFWYKSYPGETYYVAGTANVRRMLLDMLAFFDLYLKGIAHQLPGEIRPLTSLSGRAPAVLSAGGTSAGRMQHETPPRDMAN